MYVKTLLLLVLVVPAIGSDSCAELLPGEQSGSAAAPWYNGAFISLKPGASLRSFQFRPGDNGIMEFRVTGEAIRSAKGSYTADGLRFQAAADFFLSRGKRQYHYRIFFKGIRLLHYFGGTATLREYAENERLTQEVFFLFFGSPDAPDADKQHNPLL